MLLSVIHGDNTSDTISLRLMDWLVSNYSKSHHIVYYVDNIPFNMHQNYKNMLKAYSKKMFDPFRRHERIYIPYTNKDSTKSLLLETTVAQLMFFKWAIDNKVLDYAHKNKESIKYNMDVNTRHRVVKQKDVNVETQRLKRKELSKANRCVNMYRVNIKVTFS
jgi:hypothetical protein